MSNLQNVQLPIAAQHKTKLDLSCDHVTTANFMQLQPVYYRHMIKGEHINLSALATLRLLPLTVPIFGKMRINLRAFFCPWRLVFNKADHFFADTIGSGNTKSGLVSSCPIIRNNTFVGLFYDVINGVSTYGLATIVPTDSQTGEPTSVYDFKIVGGTLSNPVYIRLNSKGRAWLKLLWSLGYRFNWNLSDITTYSALALIAYARIYYDWYTNSSYLDSATILALDRIFNWNEPDALVLSIPYLSYILSLSWFVQYDNDAYFNAAWDNPMSPISSQQSGYLFNDIVNTVSNGSYGQVTNTSLYGINNPENTPIMTQYYNGTQYIGSQYLHDALKKLQNFSKRHQLSGARVIDRTLADWGFASDALQNSRTIYIGSQSIDIDTGQVLSTANTADGSLGDYAGVGRAQGSKTWDFECDEFGLFVVTASILPSGSIVQGCDRNNMKSNKFDFFTPALDGLAVQAVSRREVYMSPNGDFGGAAGADYEGGVFGFVGRYGEYKRPISWLTGDASLLSFQDANAWNLYRLFGDESFQGENGATASAIVHSLDFTRGSDWQQYNRIFNLQDDSQDKFILDIHFNVGAYAPCKPLFETYEFDELGKEITLAAQGSKVN